MNERWKPVPGYEGLYEVSDQGRVRSLARTTPDGRDITGRVLKQSAQKSGYLNVGLSRDGRSATTLVHRIVLSAFAGPCPEGMEARHVDGNKTNNAASNLAWGSHSTNNMDRVQHGTHPEARKTHCPRGHAYVEANMEPAALANRRRLCKACHREHGYATRHGVPFDDGRADARFAQIMEAAA